MRFDAPNSTNAERLSFLNLEINLVDKESCYPLVRPCLIFDAGQTSSILVQKKTPGYQPSFASIQRAANRAAQFP